MLCVRERVLSACVAHSSTLQYGERERERVCVCEREREREQLFSSECDLIWKWLSQCQPCTGAGLDGEVGHIQDDLGSVAMMSRRLLFCPMEDIDAYKLN